MATQLGGWSYARTVLTNMGKSKSTEDGSASSAGGERSITTVRVRAIAQAGAISYLCGKKRQFEKRFKNRSHTLLLERSLSCLAIFVSFVRTGSFVRLDWLDPWVAWSPLQLLVLCCFVLFWTITTVSPLFSCFHQYSEPWHLYTCIPESRIALIVEVSRQLSRYRDLSGPIDASVNKASTLPS